jgi:hypothetical protein
MKKKKMSRLVILNSMVFELRQKAYALEQEAIALRAEIERENREEFEQKRIVDAINQLPVAMRAELMQRASEI